LVNALTNEIIKLDAQTTHYVYKNLLNGVHQFKVRARLEDNTWLLSNTITLLATQNAQAIAIPNPFTDKLTLMQLPNTAKDATYISIYDSRGMLIAEKQITDGSTTWELSTATWNSGLYLVQINNGKQQQLIKVVK
jgi:hypothetical protein